MPYELVSCNIPGKCVDGIVRTPCTWIRYQFEGCSIDSSSNVIHATYTNSLPRHCFYTEDKNKPLGSATSYDAYAFKHSWNLRVSKMKSYETDVTNGNISNSDFIYNDIEEEYIDKVMCY